MIDLDFIRLVNLHKAKFPSSTERLDSTPLHNQRVGGAPASMHLKGLAVDLSFDLPEMLFPAASYALELGFGGIEVDLSNLHLHLDMRSIPWHVVKVDSKTWINLQGYLTTHPLSL